MSIQKLQQEWNTLYRQTLPDLARRRDASQSNWVVFLDHCFARIILDNAVGRDRPWASVLRSPAIKHMTEDQLHDALRLGNQIANGEVSLQELDQKSLALRGKTKGTLTGSKRQRDPGAGTGGTANSTKKQRRAYSTEEMDRVPSEARSEIETRKGAMADVWAAFRKTPQAPKPRHCDENAEQQAKLDTARERIAHSDDLSDFRKRVLTLLTQVPPGRYTTYKALAEGVAESFGSSTTSSPRAVGSAMRNNPFAPVVPCHRVLAADGKLGGFGGDWGPEGRFANEKRELLKLEGVRFDVKGKVVGSPFTGFKF